MIKVVGFGGEPASGKSTLMLAVIGNWLRWTGEGRAVKWGSRGLVTSIYPGAKVAIIGFYEPGQTFGGTDRLSMSIQPEAAQFLAALSSDEHWDGWQVFFEGDRLFTSKFIHFVLHQNIPARFFVLTCSEEALEKRHKQRADSQDARWLAGRKTKAKNIVQEFGLPRLPHNCPEDTARLALMFSEGTVWQLPEPIWKQEMMI